MRELVYLSPRKLRQFDLGKPLGGLRGRLSGEVKVPGLGGLTIDKGIERPPELDEVIAALEASDRAARWFTEDVRPGQWVQFEAPMSYASTEAGGVLFVDLDEPTPAYPTGGALRLLLHGSSRHLVGAEPRAREISDRQVDAAMGFSAGNPQRFLLEMMTDLATAATGHNADIAVERVARRQPWYAEVIDVVSRELDLPVTAAWLAGWARVTAAPPTVDGRRIVMATPLYVEYVSEPT